MMKIMTAKRNRGEWEAVTPGCIFPEVDLRGSKNLCLRNEYSPEHEKTTDASFRVVEEISRVSDMLIDDNVSTSHRRMAISADHLYPSLATFLLSIPNTALIIEKTFNLNFRSFAILPNDDMIGSTQVVPTFYQVFDFMNQSLQIYPEGQFTGFVPISTAPAVAPSAVLVNFFHALPGSCCTRFSINPMVTIEVTDKKSGVQIWCMKSFHFDSMEVVDPSLQSILALIDAILTQ